MSFWPVKGRVFALAGACAVLLAGCLGAEDVPVGVPLMNNLGRTIELRVCYSGKCTSQERFQPLKANGTTIARIEDEGTFDPVEVYSASHQLLGCLPFRIPGSPTSVPRVKLSQMVPCGGDLGRSAGSGSWPPSTR